MKKPRPEQVTIGRRCFTCVACGACCRRWLVYVPPEEGARLAALEWPPGMAPAGPVTRRVAGHDYLAHTAAGQCVFLDPESQLCRIHARFGYAAKPRPCRVYPLNLATTFPDEYSVGVRFDCPAVRANDGRPLAEGIAEYRALIAEMGLDGGFDSDDLDDLAPATARRLIGAIRRRVLDNDALPPCARPLVAALLAERLQTLGPVFLNDVDLDDILPSLVDRVIADRAQVRRRRLGALEQWRFTSYLTAFLRRDETLVGGGPAARVRRALATGSILFGRGRLRDLGGDHPDIQVGRADLFDRPIHNAADLDPALFLDLLRLRLETWQFMGPTFYHRSFFEGLAALFLAWPLVLAAAKWSALARRRDVCHVGREDLAYAVGAVDSNLGRSAFLRLTVFRVFGRHMAEAHNLIHLADTLLAGPPGR